MTAEISLTTKDAGQLGERLAALIARGHRRQAYALLAPVLAAKTGFPLLDRLGSRAGQAPFGQISRFIDQVAAAGTMGGWVVCGAALGEQLDEHQAEALAQCRRLIITASCWYGTDILGERVPGPALLKSFEPAVELLGPWCRDDRRWVRRAVGVAVHFWAKRTRGAAEPEARALLRLLQPLFEERATDAVKGIGWGLKTLGRYHPELLTGWLAEQLGRRQRSPRALMLRKAVTYLSAEQRARATGK